MLDQELDARLLSQTAKLNKAGRVEYIVLNGMTGAAARDWNLPYPGYEAWRSILINAGVLPRQILSIPPSLNTGDEAENFLSLAETKGWERIAISSQPHHQPRCFLHALSFNESAQSPNAMEIYNVPAPPIAWERQMCKPTQLGDKLYVTPVVGTYADHIEAEVQRIIDYSQVHPDERRPCRMLGPSYALWYLRLRNRKTKQAS